MDHEQVHRLLLVLALAACLDSPSSPPEATEEPASEEEPAEQPSEPVASETSLDEYLSVCAVPALEEGDFSAALAEHNKNMEAVDPPEEVPDWHSAVLACQTDQKARLDAGPREGQSEEEFLLGLLVSLALEHQSNLAQTLAGMDQGVLARLVEAGCGGALPEQFELGANYPNPFNPSTMIPCQLPTGMHVWLEVFNLLGQRIATLVDGGQPAGSHTAEWDATDAAGQAAEAGVYLYRLSGGGARITRRMLLIDGQAGVPAAGPGLVPYVDPAFQVTAGLAPVDLVVETSSSAPRAKVASGGILGTWTTLDSPASG